MIEYVVSTACMLVNGNSKIRRQIGCMVCYRRALSHKLCEHVQAIHALVVLPPPTHVRLVHFGNVHATCATIYASISSLI